VKPENSRKERMERDRKKKVKKRKQFLKSMKGKRQKVVGKQRTKDGIKERGPLLAGKMTPNLQYLPCQLVD
jgi:hypothetical protein